MDNQPNSKLIPERLKRSLNEYITEGKPLGEFLRAVVCDHFMDSFRLADLDSLHNLRHIAALVYLEMPTNLRGEAAYNAHIKRKAAERNKE